MGVVNVQLMNWTFAAFCSECPTHELDIWCILNDIQLMRWTFAAFALNVSKYSGKLRNTLPWKTWGVGWGMRVWGDISKYL